MLKKVVVLLMMIIIAKISLDSSAFKLPLFKDGCGLYTVTTGGGSSGKMYTFKTEDLHLFNNIKNITGQSLSTQSKQYINDFLLEYDCVFVFEETVDNLVIKYYYTTKISAYRSINGKKINVQTCENNDYYTIGSPLIYGGF